MPILLSRHLPARRRRRSRSRSWGCGPRPCCAAAASATRRHGVSAQRGDGRDRHRAPPLADLDHQRDVVADRHVLDGEVPARVGQRRGDRPPRIRRRTAVAGAPSATRPAARWERRRPRCRAGSCPPGRRPIPLTVVLAPFGQGVVCGAGAARAVVLLALQVDAGAGLRAAAEPAEPAATAADAAGRPRRRRPAPPGRARRVDVGAAERHVGACTDAREGGSADCAGDPFHAR